MKKILMTLGDNSMTMIYDMIVLEMTYEIRMELILTVDCWYDSVRGERYDCA